MKKLLCISVWVMSIMFCSISLFAQTLFVIPDTTPNYIAYKYLEECASAVERQRGYNLVPDTRWLDTMRVYTKEEVTTPYSNEAKAVGRMCLSNKRLDTIPQVMSKTIAKTLLAIDLDDDARNLYNRYYDSASQNDRPKHIAEWMRVYGGSIPMRLDAMKDLYEAAKREPWADTADGIMIEMGALLVRHAAMVGDTQFASALGNEVIKRNEKLSVEQRVGDVSGKLGAINNLNRTWYIYRHVYPFVHRRSYLDSLTQGHNALKGWHMEMNMSVWGDTLRVNQRLMEPPLPQLFGDFLFRSTGKFGPDGFMEYAALPREQWKDVPEKGSVNLVVNIQAGCNPWVNNVPMPGNPFTHRYNNGSGRCIETVSALRRLKEKHPEVVLTIVTRTYGTVGKSVPLTPEQEADTLAKYFLGSLKMNANLLIETTPWIRMPGNPLDDRRVDMRTPNQESLEQFYKRSSAHLAVHCVDREGRVFCREPDLGRFMMREHTLDDEIAAVLRREKKYKVVNNEKSN